MKERSRMIALADEEYQELMDLFRIARNEKATPEEITRCRELMIRHEEIEQRKRNRI